MADNSMPIKPKPKWIVTRGGVPCSLQPVPSILGPKLCPRGGILLPDPERPKLFGGVKSAEAAIARATRTRQALASAVFSLPPSCKQFVEGGDFSVERQKVD